MYSPFCVFISDFLGIILSFSEKSSQIPKLNKNISFITVRYLNRKIFTQITEHLLLVLSSDENISQNLTELTWDYLMIYDIVLSGRTSLISCSKEENICENYTGELGLNLHGGVLETDRTLCLWSALSHY